MVASQAAPCPPHEGVGNFSEALVQRHRISPPRLCVHSPEPLPSCGFTADCCLMPDGNLDLTAAFERPPQEGSCQACGPCDLLQKGFPQVNF